METQKNFRGFNTAILLELTQIAAACSDWKTSLDQIVKKTRPQFIFDNIVVYLSEVGTNRIDVLYARATGRGKSAEADASWGETVANRVSVEKQTIVEAPELSPDKDRLASPYLLGVPFTVSKSLLGILVFVRFGGPEYAPEGIEFSEFLAGQISSIVKKKCLDEFDEKLETQKSHSSLQEDFINTISHELRSPLGFIKGYTTTLLREDTTWDQKTQHDFLEIIERESNNLTELIDNLLDSSRLQSGQMKFDFQPVRIDSIIRDEVNRSAITHPDQVVELDFPEEIPPIEGDTRRLAQVFDNLLSNTHKYAPGSIIFISIHPADDSVRIEYRDSGPGIPEKFLSQLFTRFFRTPEHSINIHGTGLGLSICKHIIESHNGTISVSSPSGSGVVFTIELPKGDEING